MTPKPILLTGSHRSGSTWAGKILAASGELGYISEPFNTITRPGVCSIPRSRFFQYVTTENEAAFCEPLRRTLRFHYDASREVRALRTPKDAARMVRDWRSFRRNQGRRPLLKDPIAFFSSEWIADRFDADVVILVRHPAAFAGSLKRLNWTHPFSDFLEQPLLMRDLLAPFEKEIRDYCKPKGIIDQASLLWKMIYSVATVFRQRHPNWIFVRHEDLSSRPEQSFKELFARLGLCFNGETKKLVSSTTDRHNPREASGTHTLNRDSRSNIHNWKHRLTPEEVQRVRGLVGDSANAFYTDRELWG